jgi:hypothetical protein
MSTESPSASKPVFWIFLLGLVGLALFVLINAWLRGDETASTDPEDAARNELRIQNLADLRAEDTAKLETYAWVDQGKGEVQIPIDQAMALVISDLEESKPRPAYPVDPAAAAAMQANGDTAALPTEPVTVEVIEESVEILTAPVETPEENQ